MWCGVVVCGECYHLFMFGNGFPSRFVHFSFVASLSFRVWPVEAHRITGAGRQSPVKASPQLGTLDLHLVTAVAVFLVHTERDAWHVVPTDNRRRKSRGEHRRWQIQPCTYRCRRQRAQWCTSMSWELWARPPVLTPVPCRRTHSSQRLQRLQNCLSGPWCLAFRDCRQSKDTQHKVHRHQQIHLRTCHCHWHKPTKQTTSPLKFEPHMDRQCLIVCDPLTFVLDAPTYPY